MDPFPNHSPTLETQKVLFNVTKLYQVDWNSIFKIFYQQPPSKEADNADEYYFLECGFM